MTDESEPAADHEQQQSRDEDAEGQRKDRSWRKKRNGSESEEDDVCSKSYDHNDVKFVSKPVRSKMNSGLKQHDGKQGLKAQMDGSDLTLVLDVPP